MKILLIWPNFPVTFWSFRYALPFVGKKSAFPPLGLLTVASFLPKEWEKKLIDLSTKNLSEKDLEWADFIFLSAMIVQKESVRNIIGLAKKLNKKIIAGGPLFTLGHEDFLEDIDCLVLGEGEVIITSLLEDLKKGKLKKIYSAKDSSSPWPDINHAPVPEWSLIDMKKYATMGIQFSRGCPFNCEFCDIELLNGRVPRSKNKEKLLEELDVLYELGWRRSVFFVDDNFIGNKVKLKQEILPAIINWMEEKNYPFNFNTQLSINVSDDPELMDLMVRAGFGAVFVGIESPDEESLKECGKMQNTNRNLLESIRKIQNKGLEVQAGFILGFDKDSPSIFERMILFIQRSGIATAMVGLLQAGPKTRLWERLKREKRLISQPTGNIDCTINFLPKMDLDVLVSGYKKVISHIYSPKNYYQRIKILLREFNSERKKSYHLDFDNIMALLKSFWVLGIREKERFYYWRLLFWTVFRKPKLFPMMIEMAIRGFHFRKVSEQSAFSSQSDRTV